MSLQILTVPCLSDNYAFLAHDATSGQTAVIDVPEAAPILAALERKGWRASHVLLTHHHADHVQGLDALLAKHPAEIIGANADAHRLPPLDHAVAEGDSIKIGDESGHVLEVPGHTVGHIAFHFGASAAVFTADSLMALGCGRLFEGSADQMWDSLGKLAALPGETLVYSGHEYTEANGKFARSIDPDNPALISRCEAITSARAKAQPTVPSKLSDELATNPFLRAADPAIRAGLGLNDATDSQVFAEIRTRKDRF